MEKSTFIFFTIFCISNVASGLEFYRAFDFGVKDANNTCWDLFGSGDHMQSGEASEDGLAFDNFLEGYDRNISVDLASYKNLTLIAVFDKYKIEEDFYGWFWLLGNNQGYYAFDCLTTSGENTCHFGISDNLALNDYLLLELTTFASDTMIATGLTFFPKDDAFNIGLLHKVQDHEPGCLVQSTRFSYDAVFNHSSDFKLVITKGRFYFLGFAKGIMDMKAFLQFFDSVDGKKRPIDCHNCLNTSKLACPQGLHLTLISFRIYSCRTPSGKLPGEDDKAKMFLNLFIGVAIGITATVTIGLGVKLIKAYCCPSAAAVTPICDQTSMLCVKAEAKENNAHSFREDNTTRRMGNYPEKGEKGMVGVYCSVCSGHCNMIMPPSCIHRALCQNCGTRAARCYACVSAN